MATPWKMTGTGYEFCNCDFGCGCNFGGFPNSPDGSCRALVGVKIDSGSCGDVELSCTAPGFLDSGLTVFASTRPRPARRGRVAPGRGFDSRISPASTVRCMSA